MLNTVDSDTWLQTRCSAFVGFRRISAGSILSVVPKVKSYKDRNSNSAVLIFDDSTSQVIDVDFRGTDDEVLDRLIRRSAQAPATDNLLVSINREQHTPGRPKLGVVAREVTLLPRHWEWLSRQPGGASVALRKLVEEARKMNSDKDAVRMAQETTYRFMSAIAGDLPGFEEALRALFAGNSLKFVSTIDDWPADVRDHTLRIADGAF